MSYYFVVSTLSQESLNSFENNTMFEVTSQTLTKLMSLLVSPFFQTNRVLPNGKDLSGVRHVKCHDY